MTNVMKKNLMDSFSLDNAIENGSIGKNFKYIQYDNGEHYDYKYNNSNSSWCCLNDCGECCSIDLCCNSDYCCPSIICTGIPLALCGILIECSNIDKECCGGCFCDFCAENDAYECTLGCCSGAIWCKCLECFSPDFIICFV